jgi:outer membrane receptor protein involved in Fe transport
VRVGVDYVYTDARNREEDIPLDGRPPHRVQGQLGVRLATVDVSGSLAWEGPRPYTTEEGTTWSEAYTWLDARVAWSFLPGVSAEVGARNLLEAQDNLYLGLPPRVLYAGLRASGRPQLAKGAP